MRKRHHTKLIHEGEYVAEVDVELVDNKKRGQPFMMRIASPSPHRPGRILVRHKKRGLLLMNRVGRKCPKFQYRMFFGYYISIQ